MGRLSIKIFALITAVLILTMSVHAHALPDVGEDPPHVSPVGMNIYDLVAEDLSGRMTTENLFNKYELTLMPTWVIWSGASDTCMKLLEKQRQSLLAQRINCIGIYCEDEQHPVSYGRRYYTEQGYTMYSITNRKAPLLYKVFGRTEASIPIIYVIDSLGYVRGLISGYLSNAELTRFLLHFMPDSNIVRFIDGTDESIIYETIVKDGGYTYYPNIPLHEGFKFKYWDKPVNNITQHTIITAVYDKIGDVNFDGRVSTGDAALILKYSSGIIHFTDYTFDIADYNRSGEVNTGDAVAILKYCVGL